MSVSKKASQEADRFELPKASVGRDREGRPVYGVCNRPAKAHVAGHFEAAKAAENDAVLDRMAQPPSGPRTASRKELEKEWERREREAEARGPTPALAGPRGAHMRTSSQHPLSGAALGALGAGVGAGADQRQQQQQQQRHCGGPDCAGGGCGSSAAAEGGGAGLLQTSKRVYSHAELPPGLRPHLAGAGVHQLDDFEDSGEEERGEDEAEAGKAAALRAAAEARALRDRLCREFPHGVPRQVLARLRCEGGAAAQLADLLRLDGASVGST